MTQSEYELYSRKSYDDFIAHAAATSGEALDTIRVRVGNPPAIPAESDLILNIEYKSDKIGCAWIQLNLAAKEAFGFDFHIDEQYRGMGLGRQTLEAGRDYLRTLGIKTLKICVFDDSKAALHLYASLGFRETEYKPAKKQRRMQLEI